MTLGPQRIALSPLFWFLWTVNIWRKAQLLLPAPKERQDESV